MAVTMKNAICWDVTSASCHFIPEDGILHVTRIDYHWIFTLVIVPKFTSVDTASLRCVFFHMGHQTLQHSFFYLEIPS
jgi:hypothetical protein